MDAPKIGDKFDMTPDLFDIVNHETVIVTDVQITPTGFIVEGLPVDRDPDDYSIMVREFLTA